MKCETLLRRGTIPVQIKGRSIQPMDHLLRYRIRCLQANQR